MPGRPVGWLLRRQAHPGDLWPHPGRGASVFDFPDIVGPGAWKQRYRDNLDALEWSAEERQAFVDEAKGAYLHHSKVFDELAEL
ncbi:MAG: biliverdin-producing heme oxygenase [Candidatus Microthrix sp.]|nr:biliverdin-producing heme oxygenase [Candidatus Microthrix sp.]